MRRSNLFVVFAVLALLFCNSIETKAASLWLNGNDLYSSQGAARNYQPGDIITIVISEQSTAQSKATTKTEKESKTEVTATNRIPIFKKIVNKITGDQDIKNEFDGYFVEFTDKDGNDLVFCDSLCAKEKEILECDVCESYETYTESYIVDDKIYCSEKCLSTRGYKKCDKCDNFDKKVDKNSLCTKCSPNSNTINKKEIYNEKYNAENLDLKIVLSNTIYRKKLQIIRI